MSIREEIKQKLYNRIADYLSVARGYFIASLYGPTWARKLARAEEDLREGMKDSLTRTREAFAYADRFLKKWRENRGEGWTYSLQEKPKPNPYCKHLKGGRIRGVAKDYNVAGHTFPDGRVKIWCLNGCGFEAYPKDANWQEAVAMLDESSNKRSSSERTMFAKKSEIKVVYQDKL
jgi:hypothetical protein